MKKVDRENLFVRDSKDTRGHGNKFRILSTCKDTKKYNFSYINIDIWNNLDIEFKVRLDDSRYVDGKVSV